MTNEQVTFRVQCLRSNQTDEEISKIIGITKPTLYSRLITHKWKLGEIKIIKDLK